MEEEDLYNELVKQDKEKQAKELFAESEEDDGEADDNHGTRKPLAAKVPRAPTQKELDERLPLNLEFKSWRPVCVRTGGRQLRQKEHP